MNKSSAPLNWSDISSQAQSDPEFRKLLIENPRQAIENRFDVVLPKNVNYVVHEQTSDTVHLILPPIQSSVDAQRISDDDEETDAQRISDDDEETDAQRISDDDEEIDAQRISDDDEEIDPES